MKCCGRGPRESAGLMEYPHEPVRRVYPCGTVTIEVPASVGSYLGRAKLAELMAHARRQAEKAKRNDRIRAMRADGWKVDAIAQEVGMHHTSVRDVLRQGTLPTFNAVVTPK